MILQFIGLDYWSRPVYKDENGCLVVDVDDRVEGLDSLYTKCDNEFEGEPDWPIIEVKSYQNQEIEFVPKRYRSSEQRVSNE